MKMLRIPISFLTDGDEQGQEDILRHLRDRWHIVSWAFSQEDMRNATIVDTPEPSNEQNGEQAKT